MAAPVYPLAALARDLPDTDGNLARVLGLDWPTWSSRRDVRRIRHRGQLTEPEADALAAWAGTNPRCVWPRWGR